MLRIAEPQPQGGGWRFDDVWRAVCSDPYTTLPTRRVSLRDLPHFVRGSLLRDARRTLDDGADVLPYFDKLVHPYGFCLSGTWQIDQATPYDGYFAEGSHAQLIARASDAIGETRPGKLRFLGLAGKLFATASAATTVPLPTANFFCLENLSGTHTPHFAHARMCNDLLQFFPHPGAAVYAPLGAVAGVLFARADDTWDLTRAAIRQLYPIAELGHSRRPARAPRFLRIVGHEANARVTTSDLREELAAVLRSGGLHFHIDVADGRMRIGPRHWQRIGRIHFTEGVASASGDHRLHFAHPRYRSTAT